MTLLFNNPTFKLGELLIQKNYITQEILDFALNLQTKCKSKLGNILLSEGLINSEQLYISLAEQFNIEFINLREVPCDSSLLSTELVQFYIKYQAIPWRKEQDTIIIAVSELNPETFNWIATNFSSYKLIMTSNTHIQWNLEQIFHSYYLNDSINNLKDRFPEQSSHYILCTWQKFFTIFLTIILSLGLIFNTQATIFIVFIIINLCYLFSNIFKTTLYIAGLYSDNKEGEKYGSINDSELPLYTILLPLLNEKEILPRLIFSINALNYPKAKLDVKLIVEEDDLGTINAIEDLECGDHFKIIKVPKALPRTKPKALNYALRFARGKYITIYDAEDRPHPDQLRKIIAIFQTSSPDVVCIQSKLNFFNREENLLTKFFAIEYSLLFDLALKGLYQLNMPIPLGGTSNHFLKDKLEELGGWDPFNVTEDADIGIRLYYKHYSTNLVNSLTLEESPLTLKAWITQRARWIKGYILTYFVHMRNPKQLFSSLGLSGFIGIQCFIGLPILCFLTSPLMWFICVGMRYFYHSPSLSYNIISNLWYINLIYSLMLPIISAFLITLYNNWSKMSLACLLFPFYFILHSIASLQALWYLITAPSRWDKTKHGVSEYI